ncbi:MAG: hypothetical protein AAF810_15380 [Cyanobacteria bacterium P01_D01_bin.36]
MIYTNQSEERLMRTTHSESISGDLISGEYSFGRSSFAFVAGDRISETYGTKVSMGAALHTFIYRPDSLLSVDNDCLNLVKQIADQATNRPAWQLSKGKLSEQPKTYRSRDCRPLAILSS